MKSFVGAFMAILTVATELAAQPPITAMALSPDERSLVIGSQAGVQVLSWPELQPERSLNISMVQVHDLAFSRSGAQLAIGGGTPGESGELVVCDWPTAKVSWRKVAHADVIYSVAWCQDDSVLATAGGDQRVRCLAAADGRIQQTLPGHTAPVLAVAALPGQAALLSAGADHSLRVWDLNSGGLLRSLDHHTEIVRDVAVRPSADGPVVAASAGADRTVRFWQPTIGRLVRFARLPAEPLSLAWCSDGRSVAVGSIDGHLRIIDAESLEILRDEKVLDGWVYEVAASRTDPTCVAGGSLRECRRVTP